MGTRFLTPILNAMIEKKNKQKLTKTIVETNKHTTSNKSELSSFYLKKKGSHPCPAFPVVKQTSLKWNLYA